MDYARQQRDPTRHLIGIAFVVAGARPRHLGAVTGLGSKPSQVIKKPLTATIIEEIKLPPPPPPPPPKKIIEPPKAPPPPQPYVPPPDIPPPCAVEPPIIRPSRQCRRPSRRDRAAAAPVVVAPPPPPPPPKPAVRRGVTRLSGDDPDYPREAIKAGVEKGRVVARLQIDEKGNVTDVDHRVGRSAARFRPRRCIDALTDWKF